MTRLASMLLRLERDEVGGGEESGGEGYRPAAISRSSRLREFEAVESRLERRRSSTAASGSSSARL